MILKTLSPKTLLSLSPSSSSFRCSIFISYFSTTLPSSQGHGGSFSRRQHEEESRNVRVSVWWDFENCSLPIGVNVLRVAQLITAAIRANGIKGPVQITAFGDVTQLSRANQEGLSATGINLTHIPNGGKNSADRSLLVDLMYWVSQNPPPAHLFLISGDRDFAGILHRLRMNNYNILLASKEATPSVLCSAASIMWQWNALLRGENLTGRYFNQPPDGPYGSWYGHYKVPLEDPFSVVEQQQPPRSEESSESGSEPRIRPIPKPVIKQIRHILSLNPQGISIGELRLELGKSNVAIDKDLYGYKKFSRFLLAMPHVLKLQSIGSGQYVVCNVTAKAPEPFQPNTCSTVDQESQHLVKSWNSNGENTSISEPMNVKASSSITSELNAEEPTGKLQQQPPFPEKVVKVDVEQPMKKMEKPTSDGEKVAEVVNAQATNDHLPAVKEHESRSEVGIFKKIWKRWFGSKDEYSEIRNDDIPKKLNSRDSSETTNENIVEKCGPSSNGTENVVVKEKVVKPPSKEEKIEVENKYAKPQSQDNDPAHTMSISPSNTKPASKNQAHLSSKLGEEETRKNPGLFNRIISWFKFRRNNPNSYTLGDQPNESFEQLSSSSGKNKYFSDDSFWRDIESFVDTQKGALIISQSKTREQMAENLQKGGPLVLTSLSKADILQLVDMLISEKKWIEECSFEALPFKLTRSVENNTCLGNSHASNGLRSLFLSIASKSDLRELREQIGEKETQNISHGPSTLVTNKKQSGRSRHDILADCQKLANEIVKEYPEGFNLGCFRKLFFERYGYYLDVQKLGYRKLASLIQLIPDVKVDSNYIFAADKAPIYPSQDAVVPGIQENNANHTVTDLESELSGASKKDDESDSPWEELGPVDNTGSSRKELPSDSRRRAMDETLFDYEPALSGDESSDSEGDSLTVTRPQGQDKNDEDNSSLLQILDSWYSSKEGDNKKDKSEKMEEMVDCSRRSVQQSDSSGQGAKADPSLRSHVRKHKATKSYSFVEDPVVNHKDKLITSILGSLNNSGESRMRN